MTRQATHRLALVHSLLELAKPIAELSEQLGAMDWDYVGVTSTLTRHHLQTALQRYLDNSLSAEEVETWANLIEGRDDVSFEAGHERLIEDLLYELANPLLTQSLHPRRALALRNSLI